MIINKCAQIRQWNTEIIANCYRKISRHFQTNPISYNKSWMEYISHFTNEAIVFAPEFSAAGFFELDYAANITIFNMLTTYVIVIVQFDSPSQ